jgi:lysophospholipase L1-like esterase
MTWVRTSVVALMMTFAGIASQNVSAAPAVAGKAGSGIEQLTAKNTPLRQGDSIAFFGDSVTMQGGYIDMMKKAVNESPNTKDLGIQFFQHGLNGGRVPTVLEGKSPWGDLHGTMQELIDKEQPKVVVIYLGINDVWHGDKGTTKPDYEAGLKKMIDMCKKAKATTILCTPTVIGEDIKNKLNAKLGEYSEVVRKLAKENKLTLCDLHTAFIDELKKINKENKHQGNLTHDGVHMKPEGNAILADKISAAIVTALKQRNTR